MQILPNQITKEALVNLCKSGEEGVSIVISSITNADFNKKIELKFRNSLKLAKKLIEDKGRDSSKILKQLESIDVNKELVKIPHTKTLVILATSKNISVFNLLTAVKATPIVVFQKSFYIRYLIREINLNQVYYLLDLSQNDTNVYEVNRYTINDINSTIKLPKGVENVFDMQRDPAKQYHTKGKTSVFHGHGGKKDEHEELTVSYLHEVDRMIIEKIKDKTIPIMLATTDNIIAIFRQLTKYPLVWESALKGNVDKLTLNKVHNMANKQLRKQVDLEISKLYERINSQQNAGKASSDFDSLFEASSQGRIENIIINKDLVVWGSIGGEEKVQVNLSRGENDIDLVNLLICKVLSSSGQVYIDVNNSNPNGLIGEFRF